MLTLSGLSLHITKVEKSPRHVSLVPQQPLLLDKIGSSQMYPCLPTPTKKHKYVTYYYIRVRILNKKKNDTLIVTLFNVRFPVNQFMTAPNKSTSLSQPHASCTSMEPLPRDSV